MQDSLQEDSIAPDPGGLHREEENPDHIEINDGEDSLKVRLLEPNQSVLEDGESYLWLAHTSHNALQLRLSHMTNGYLREFTILECDYKTLCNMDWIKSMDIKNEVELATLLGHLYIAAEQGVSRMSLESLKLHVIRKNTKCHDNNNSKVDHGLEYTNRNQHKGALSKITKVLKHQIQRPGECLLFQKVLCIVHNVDYFHGNKNYFDVTFALHINQI